MKTRHIRQSSWATYRNLIEWRISFWLLRLNARSHPRICIKSLLKMEFEPPCTRCGFCAYKTVDLVKRRRGLVKLSFGLRKQNVDFVNGWYDLPRRKIAVPRRFYMWPETREAIAAAMKARPVWWGCTKGTKTDSFGKSFTKLCVKLDIKARSKRLLPAPHLRNRSWRLHGSNRCELRHGPC